MTEIGLAPDRWAKPSDLHKISILIYPESINTNQFPGCLPRPPKKFLQIMAGWGIENTPPILVRRKADYSFELIDGKRRLAAARILKWRAIRAMVEPEPKPAIIASRTELGRLPPLMGWRDLGGADDE